MQKIIIGNWKENPENLVTARNLVAISENFENKRDEEFWRAVENKTSWPKDLIKIVHAVPSIFAEKLFLESRKTKIILQNISEHESGSHTGEISVKQMLDCGIKASIVGHSETRLSPQNLKGDEDSQVNLKIKNLIKNECGFILCVGEYERLEPGLHRLNDFADFDSEHFKFVKTQLEKCLDGIEAGDIADNVIAYEPVWAIGKNAKRVAANEEIIEMIGFIKKFIKNKFGVEAHVLYGGSVDENNAKEILNLEGVDGLLVGRASSDPEKWQKLLENIGNDSRGQTVTKKALNCKTISDLEIQSGDIVLLRLDLNVPINDKNELVNDFRIQESLKTIKYLQSKDAKIIILAHKEKGNLELVAKHINEKIKLTNFKFVSKVVDSEVEVAVKNLQSGEILLLDNVRLDEREKKNDTEFAKYFLNLAKLNIKNNKSLFGIFAYGDKSTQPKIFYVNEAFSASHRKHTSIVGIPTVMQEKGFGNNCALGFKFAEEIEKLSLALEPKHPMLLVVGGAKFDTKLAMLNKFINIADNVFVGGALAHNFWKQKFNYHLGKSLLDEEVKLEESILQEIDKKIMLPSDVVIESRETKTANQILENERIVDFGENTLMKISALIEKSKTIVWNGPLGYYEGGFEWGTKNLLLKLSELQSKFPEKIIILGGGDTVTEIDKLDEELASSGKEKLKFTHVSTGGGAMIDFLSNGTLPGIEAVLQ